MRPKPLATERAVWLLLVSILRLAWWATAPWRWLRRRRAMNE